MDSLVRIRLELEHKSFVPALTSFPPVPGLKDTSLRGNVAMQNLAYLSFCEKIEVDQETNKQTNASVTRSFKRSAQRICLTCGASMSHHRFPKKDPDLHHTTDTMKQAASFFDRHIDHSAKPGYKVDLFCTENLLLGPSASSYLYRQPALPQGFSMMVCPGYLPYNWKH